MCGNVWCFRCRAIGGHAPATCKMLKDWKSSSLAEEMDAGWLLEHTRQCPHCNMRQESAGGCDHRVCVRRRRTEAQFALHYTTMHCTALHCTALHCVDCRYTHCIAMYSPPAYLMMHSAPSLPLFAFSMPLTLVLCHMSCIGCNALAGETRPRRCCKFISGRMRKGERLLVMIAPHQHMTSVPPQLC